MADILEKIGKLLNQAERASTEEEAAAFFEQAQKLGTKYSIDLAMARSAVAKLERREQPVAQYVTIADTPGMQLKAVFCELFMDIGRAYDIKFNIASNSTYVIAFGMPSDIEMAKALYASVSQDMIRFAKEYIASGEWKSEKISRYNPKTYQYEYKTVNARVVKRNFYEAFSSRIGMRLRQAKNAAKNEIIAADKAAHGVNTDGQTGTELVLVEKSLEIRDFYKSKSRARGTWKGNTNTYRSNSGLSAGRAAGDRASLGGQKSLSGGRKAIG